MYGQYIKSRKLPLKRARVIEEDGLALNSVE